MAQNAIMKVITNAYLLDGTGNKPVKDVTIVIKGKIIEDVVKTLDAPKETKGIDERARHESGKNRGQ